MASSLYVGSYANYSGWSHRVYYKSNPSELVNLSDMEEGREVCVEVTGDVDTTHYSFDHWVFQMSGNTTNYTSNPLTFRVPTDASVIITYVCNRTYWYQAESDNTSYGTVEALGDGYASPGETVTVTAHPKTGYVFDHWEYTGSSGTRTSTSDPLEISMPSYNVAFIAYFKRIVCSVSVSGETGGNPKFSDGTKTKAVEYGTKVSVVANPSTGYVFKEWTISEQGSTIMGLSETQTLTIRGDTTIVCKYQKQMCSVTVSAGTGGTSKFSDGTYIKNVEYGTSVTIVATPSTGYVFSQWSFDNGSSAITATYTFTVKRPEIEIVAVFAADSPTPTYSVSISHRNASLHIGSTTITAGSRTQTVQRTTSQNVMSGIEAGTTVTLSSTGYDGGYTFGHWEFSGISPSTSTTSTFTFTMPSNNVSVNVVYIDSHRITFSNDAEVTATIVGNEVTVMFTGSCTDSGGDDIIFNFYKSGSIMSGSSALRFSSGRVITAADNCSRTVTLTEEEMAKTSITFQLFAHCYQYSGHDASKTIYFNPQSGSGESGDDPGGDDPGGDDSGGSVIVNSGYGLYYWNGAEWIGIIPIALENGGVTNGE